MFAILLSICATEASKTSRLGGGLGRSSGSLRRSGRSRGAGCRELGLGAPELVHNGVTDGRVPDVGELRSTGGRHEPGVGDALAEGRSGADGARDGAERGVHG